MIRICANIILIICFLIALQSYTDYLFMRKITCPPEITKTVDKCKVPCRACPTQPAAENPPQCCPSSDDYIDPPDATRCADVAGEASVPSPCPDPVQKAKCCVLVHPFWIEPPLKLTFQPPNPSTFLPEPGRLIDVTSLTIIPEENIPPWGVHPIISTTVLRI